MLKVYVAGKYSADNVIDVLQNIGRGRNICAEIFRLGMSPFCPWHDADFIIQNPNQVFNVQSFRDYCLDWLRVSDVLFIFSGAKTHAGVIDEIALANELKMPIFITLTGLIKYKEQVWNGNQ